MANLRLTLGETYNLKVTRVQTDGKFVSTKKKGECWRFFLDLADKKGDSVRAEYLSQDALTTPFIDGVFQYIKCTAVASGFEAYTIEPAEEPTSLSSMRREVNSMLSASANSGVSIPDPLPYKPNCHVANIQGTSIAFSMAYAKDILVAEIAARGSAELVTDRDIRRMLGWSQMINEDICDKINLENHSK